MKARRERVIALEAVKAMGASTHSIKDDSARGIRTVSTDTLKLGDRVLIENHFYTIA